MKIIDIGKCIDNVDPLGMGRIRCSRFNDITGQKERALNYNAWDDNDLFTASPFLPTNINFIPEINQSVKIISYNTEKENVNVEYIAGPFTTMFDFNGQTYSQQIANTSYGVNVEEKPAIINSSGKYIDKDSDNTFANNKDYAIYGKYGSDVLFTENGLQLRGGKLLSKDAATPKKRKKMIDYPLMAKKSSKIYLKKFSKKMVLDKQIVKEKIYPNKDLNYLIEYNVTQLQSPFTTKLYVYKIVDTNGDTFKTNYFSEHTLAPTSGMKLINTDNTTTTPTYTFTASTISDVYKELRDKLFTIHDGGLKELNDQYNGSDIHPFYFRPSKDFRNLIPTGTTQEENKQIILNNVNCCRVGPSSGLIWSLNKAKMDSEDVESIKDVLNFDKNSSEQTFGAVVSDKIYFLSTDLGDNESENPVPFYDLNGYEYTQEDYIKKIDPSTFSTVRGENLLRLLKVMIQVIFTHRHNPLMPIVNQFDYQDGNDLKELFKTLENDILNKSIRIN